VDPLCKPSVTSLPLYLFSPVPSLPSPTMGCESLLSVKVIFPCFKRSAYSSYYSKKGKKKVASFFGMEVG
jgi:hypothetical protein